METKNRYALAFSIAVLIHIAVFAVVGLLYVPGSESRLKEKAVKISLADTGKNATTPPEKTVKPAEKKEVILKKKTGPLALKRFPLEQITKEPAKSVDPKVGGTLEQPVETAKAGVVKEGGSVSKPEFPVEPESATMQAKTKKLVEPIYPAISRRKAEEGRVVLSLRIAPDGSVESVTTQRSSGYPRLDRAAMEAARKSIFEPAMESGVPVSSNKKIAFKFLLENRDRFNR